MSRPIVRVQQQGGLHLFTSAFLLGMEKAYGDHYQDSLEQQGNECTNPTGRQKRSPPLSWMVSKYANT